jgi:DNA polymerase-3 subunit delta'
MSAWDVVVGQGPLVDSLRRSAAAGRAILLGNEVDERAARSMTHAWLFTGPPGSGRSVVAGAFAAALQCDAAGCGECSSCRQVAAGTHPGVRFVRALRLSYGVDEARELVTWTANRPPVGSWRIVVIEDADRLTEQAANALLKVLEEPPTRVVWLLCAPSTEDLLATVRSRARVVRLTTPSRRAIADFLQRSADVDPAMAAYAARAAQGHIGRAKALALSEASRHHRHSVLATTRRLETLAGCYAAAADLHDAAKERGEAGAEEREAAEVEEVLRGYGSGAEGVRRGRVEALARRAVKTLQEDQAKRRTRALRDELDRDLVDLLGYYRDVLAVQVGAGVELVNEEDRPHLEHLASASEAAMTVQRMRVIEQTRVALASSITPLVALEAMTTRLSGRV